MSDPAPIEVVDQPAAGRFVMTVGRAVAGRTEYVDRPGRVRVFVHTVVEPGFEGRGLASRLISAALEATRAAGMQVVAECEFVQAYVRRHPDDYRDLVVDPPL